MAFPEHPIPEDIQSPETTPDLKPEKPNEHPLRHLAIAIERHKPWTDEEIPLAANLLSNFADIATLLGVEKLTIFYEDLSEDLTETEKIKAGIGEDNNRIPLTFQSPHERAQIIDAVKKMREDGMAPEDVTEEMIDSYLPPKPDLVIVTQASFSKSAKQQNQSRMFTLPGTVMSTAYSEYAVVQSGFLDMTVDDFLAAIQEYRKRERKFGELPKEDWEF